MRASFLRSRLMSSVALCASLAVAHAQIRIADQPGLGSFTSLQAAITAAPPGGLLLVESGTYGAALIDGKSLSIVEVPGAIAKTTGTLTIRNITAAKRVLISGLEIKGVGAAGIVLENNVGPVRLLDCKVTGGVIPSPAFSDAGAPGLKVTDCSKLVVAGGSVTGGDATHSPGDVGGDGGAGIDSLDSNVAVFDATVKGGKGGLEGTPGGPGGDACHIVGWGLVGSGCTFTGGNGGGGDYIGCNLGGDGGDALEVQGAQAQLLDITLAGGAGGWNSCGGDAPYGRETYNLGGTINQLTGTRRKLTALRLSSDGTNLSLTVLGQAGDKFFLARSTTPGFLFQTSWHGIWLLPTSTFAATRSIGTIPAGGSLTSSLRIADISPAALHQLQFLQGYCVDLGGQIYVTSPVHVEVLDRQAAPDCDFDTVNDSVALIEQLALDCNRNLAPDACDIATGLELDCNLNGVPDVCDLSSGAELDCNGNAIPDTCDFASGFAQDCNANSVPDSCDIANGSSTDFDQNGVPDECQPHNPTTLWIDPAAPAGGDGTQAHPFQTIQQGIDASFDTDTLMLRDGTYTGAANRNLDPDGREIVIRSENGPAACVIDCQNFGRAFAISSGESLNFVLRGLTFRNGNANVSSFHPSNGGAIYIGFADATVDGCVFENCRGRLGGAVWASATSAVIRDCIFRNCKAPSPGTAEGRGGGLMLNGGSYTKRPLVVSTQFIGCTADVGGALDVGGYGPTRVSHCTFIGNSATGFGGAIVATSWSPSNVGFLLMDDCLIANNSSDSGGAIALGAAHSAPTEPAWKFTNCTFAANSAADAGGAVHVWGNSYGVPPIEISNCVLWGNTALSGSSLFHYGAHVEIRVAASDVENGQAGFVFDPTSSLVWAGTNITADPQFADADGPDGDPLTYGDNDFRLGPSSPCIDAGDFTLVAPDASDIDGDGDFLELVPLDLDLAPRFVDVPGVPDTGAGPPPIVDLGCYERP